MFTSTISSIVVFIFLFFQFLFLILYILSLYFRGYTIKIEEILLFLFLPLARGNLTPE